MPLCYLQASHADLEGRLQDAQRVQVASQKVEGTLREVQAQLTEAKSAAEAQASLLRAAQEAAQVGHIMFTISFHGARHGPSIPISMMCRYQLGISTLWLLAAGFGLVWAHRRHDSVSPYPSLHPHWYRPWGDG